MSSKPVQLTSRAVEVHCLVRWFPISIPQHRGSRGAPGVKAARAKPEVAQSLCPKNCSCCFRRLVLELGKKPAMAARCVPTPSLLLTERAPLTCLRCQWSVRRQASTTSNEVDVSEDVVPDSSLLVPEPSEDILQSWDPVQRSRSRREQLPPSRYSPLPSSFSSIRH